MGVSPQQQDWSPNDNKSPFYVWHLLTNEEWLRISRGYPFSVRVLIKLQQSEVRWHELARTNSHDQAKDLMQALAYAKREKDWWIAWVVMECEQRDDEVREKPVLWYPTQEHVLATMRNVGLLKTTEAP